MLIAFDGSWAEDYPDRARDDTNVGWMARNYRGPVHYFAGVGERGGLVGKILGGALGIGFRDRIREAAHNLRIWHNHNPHMDLYFTGWSRGACQAVHLANLMAEDIQSKIVLLLYDPVPGPFHWGWKLERPPHAIVYTVYRRENWPGWLFRPLWWKDDYHYRRSLPGDHTHIGRGRPARRWLADRARGYGAQWMSEP